MAAVLHLVDQRRLIDSNGISDGATLTFYLTGTTTLATIYADVGLTTPRTNPVVVGAGAAVPTFYLDGTVTYKRVITYSDGSTDQTDPYTLPDYLAQAGTSATNAAASAVAAAASAAAAAESETNAVAAEEAVTAAFLNGDAFTDTTVAAAVTTGLAAVANGEYFIATGDDIDEVRQYQDVSGTATLIFSVPKLSAITSAIATFTREYGTALADDAGITEGFYLIEPSAAYALTATRFVGMVTDGTGSFDATFFINDSDELTVTGIGSTVTDDVISVAIAEGDSITVEISNVSGDVFAAQARIEGVPA